MARLSTVAKRIGEVLAGDVRGRAMDRLVERAPAPGRIGRAERGRGQHAERARQHGGAIGEQVAEQIVGDDDVELLGLAHQLHGAIVGVHVAELDVGIFGVVQLLHLLAPEHAALHDVGLLDRADLAAALARQLEGDAGDAHDLGGRVDLGIDAARWLPSGRVSMPRGSPK